MKKITLIQAGLAFAFCVVIAPRMFLEGVVLKKMATVKYGVDDCMYRYVINDGAKEGYLYDFGGSLHIDSRKLSFGKIIGTAKGCQIDAPGYPEVQHLNTLYCHNVKLFSALVLN